MMNLNPEFDIEILEINLLPLFRNENSEKLWQKKEIQRTPCFLAANTTCWTTDSLVNGRTAS